MSNRSRPKKRGLILLEALLLLFVLSSFVSAAAVLVRVSYETDRRFSRTGNIQRALDAGLAKARARIVRHGSKPLELRGSLAGVSYSALGEPSPEGVYRLEVRARHESGEEEVCRALLRVTEHEGARDVHIMEYIAGTESGRSAPELPQGLMKN